MNTWGIALAWLGVQVSMLCVLGTILYWLARRACPQAASSALNTVMTVVVGFTLLAPWLRWDSTSAPLAWLNTQVSGNSHHGTNSAGFAETLPTADKANHSQPVDEALQAGLWAQLLADLRAAEIASAQATAWRWPAWIALFVGLGVALGLLRIAAALWAVNQGVRRTVHLCDSSVQAILRELQANIGHRNEIRLRVSHVSGSPYTVGWLRPIIVLPADWQSWSRQDLRGVLAHEVAHVHRHDYAWGLVAQWTLALHFYNPLVHWLVRRLRLEQELSADHWGARLGGGRQLYLQTLARMILQPIEVPLAARPFLPSTGNFIRRIEMLHAQSIFSERPATARGTLLTAGALLLAAVCVSLLPAPHPVTAAPPEPTVEATEKRDGADASQADAHRRQSRDNLKNIAIAMHVYHDVHKHFPAAVTLGPDGKTPHSWRVELLPYLDRADLYKRYRMNEPWDSENNQQVMAEGAKLFSVPGSNSDTCGYFAVVGPGSTFDPAAGPTSIRQIRDGTSRTIGIVEAKRSIPWTKPEDIVFTADDPLPKWGGYFDGGANVMQLDGAVLFVPTDTPDNVRRAMISKAGGERFDAEGRLK